MEKHFLVLRSHLYVIIHELSEHQSYLMMTRERSAFVTSMVTIKIR